MPTLSFAVTYDYRCPFARNAHEHVVAGLRAGADWEVEFVPFSLGQVHVPEGEAPVWERPEVDSGLLALRVSTVVRDRHPERFLDVHEALFAARHDQALQIREREVLAEVLTTAGLDADAILDEAESPAALDAVQKAHESAATERSVWGVPTFVVGERAAFVRLMDRPRDGGDSTGAIERVVSMLGDWPELNEFKHTSLSR